MPWLFESELGSVSTETADSILTLPTPVAAGKVIFAWSAVRPGVDVARTPSLSDSKSNVWATVVEVIMPFTTTFAPHRMGAFGIYSTVVTNALVAGDTIRTNAAHECDAAILANVWTGLEPRPHGARTILNQPYNAMSVTTADDAAPGDLVLAGWWNPNSGNLIFQPAGWDTAPGPGGFGTAFSYKDARRIPTTGGPVTYTPTRHGPWTQLSTLIIAAVDGGDNAGLPMWL